MPKRTERQQTADAIIEAYLVSLISESRASLDPPASSSSSSDSNSSSDSDSDLEGENGLPAASGSDTMVQMLSSLYSHRYLTIHQPINKSGKNL